MYPKEVNDKKKCFDICGGCYFCTRINKSLYFFSKSDSSFQLERKRKLYFSILETSTSKTARSHYYQTRCMWHYFPQLQNYSNYSNLVRTEKKIIYMTVHSLRRKKIQTFFQWVPKLESTLINAH